jgi:hypothetical protein
MDTGLLPSYASIISSRLGNVTPMSSALFKKNVDALRSGVTLTEIGLDVRQ